MPANFPNINPGDNFYFGGGGPGAGYFQQLMGDYLTNFQRNEGGAGLPALARSSASEGPAKSYQAAPFTGRPGTGGAVAGGQSAFGDLGMGLRGAQSTGAGVQSKIREADLSGVGDTAAGYSDALSGAIQNAIQASRYSTENQLQTAGLFGQLLNSGLDLGGLFFGGPAGAVAGQTIGRSLTGIP
jgi:hypothetical protein